MKSLKQHTAYFSLLVIALLVFFAGCKNLFESPQKDTATTSQNTATVTFNLDLPSSFNSANTDTRSATIAPSAASNFTYTAKATADGQTDVSADFETTVIPLNLPIGCTWTVTIQAKVAVGGGGPTIVLQGQKEIEVTGPLSEKMFLSVYTGEDATNGSISLLVGCDAGVATRFSYSFTNSTGNSMYTGKSPLNTQTVDNFYTPIDLSNVAPGTYGLLITFIKGSQNVYTLATDITVYPGLTTNYWECDEGVSEGVFTLTAAMVSSYQRRVFYVRGDGATILTAKGTPETGSSSAPFTKIQDAVDKVISANDALTTPGSVDYTIYVDGTFTHDTENAPLVNFATLASDASFIANRNNKLNLSIIGLDAENKAVLQAHPTNGRVIDATSKDVAGVNTGNVNIPLNLTLKNLAITGGKVDDSTFGPATKAGGGIYYRGYVDAGYVYTLTLDNCQVYKNTAEYGAGVCIYGGHLILQNNTVIGDKSEEPAATAGDCSNTATKGGGGINATGAYTTTTVTIKDGCYVARNIAYSTLGDACGGGIMIENGAKLIMESGSVVQYNVAQTEAVYVSAYGGGIYALGSSTVGKSKIKLTGCTVKGNSADSVTGTASGGGMYIGEYVYGEAVSDPVLIKNCKLVKNIATGNVSSCYGGGLAIASASVTLDGGCIGTENTALVAGTQITAVAAPTAVAYSNKAVYGGGVYVTNNGSFNMKGDAFIAGNYAGDGGGIYVDGGNVSIGAEGDTAPAVYGNAALNVGGVTNDGANGKVNLYGSVHHNISLESHAGGVSLGSGAEFTMYSGSSIKDNRAKTPDATSSYAGGVHLTGGTFTMNGGTIENNGIIDSVFTSYDVMMTSIATLKMAGGAPKIGGTGSGGALMDGSGVYLKSGALITVAGSLALQDGATCITTITPESYNATTQVLAAGSGVTLANEVGKFAVTQQNIGDKWVISASGYLAKETGVNNPTNLCTAIGNLAANPVITLSGDCLDLEPQQTYLNKAGFDYGKDYVIDIPEDTSVTIKGDGDAKSLGSTSNQCGNLIKISGTLILENIKILGSNVDLHWATLDVAGGTLILNNCEISGISTGGGGGGTVCVSGGGSVIMNGGSITGNHNNGESGGVYIGAGSSFTNNGGTIEDNTKGSGSSYGSVDVYVAYGATYINNGGTVVNRVDQPPPSSP